MYTRATDALWTLLGLITLGFWIWIIWQLAT